MSFDLGGNTLHVPASLFVENRRRLVAELKKTVGPKAVVVLQGGKETNRYNTDAADLPFRQESYFFWTFGVHESESYGVIDVDSGRSLLFPPRLHKDYMIWEGKINGEDWFKAKYEVDEVHFNDPDAIQTFIGKLTPNKLLLLKADNTDSGNVLLPANFNGIENFATDDKLLYPVIAELRVFKTDAELAVLRYASKIASEAHKAAMKQIKPDLYEYQMERGCNGSILHYGHANAPNARQIKDGDMCLFDMGPEYNCYASDITTSFPVNGKFTENQKIIYNAVLRSNRAVLEKAKPGVRWTAMHILAERVILEDLKAAGLLVGDVEEMLKYRLGAVFMPHGLGHFMGLDVHDVGGYLGDAMPRSSLPGLRSLRTTRILQERMVITIEPGCYFIDFLLDEALANPDLAKFMVKEKIAPFRGTGGVRIEDDVIIWGSKPNENMSDVPRSVDEIEAFMATK